MVEGQSGLLNVCPPDNRPEYQPSKRRSVWKSGAMVTLYSANEPALLRGFYLKLLLHGLAVAQVAD